MEVTHDLLQTWCMRKTKDKGTLPAPKTEDNRITTWNTFLTRAQQLKYLAPGEHAGQLLPQADDPGFKKEDFQGRSGGEVVGGRDPLMQEIASLSPDRHLTQLSF